MYGSTVVFIVVPIVIPLVLAIGVALPFIAARDTAWEYSSARQPDRTPVRSAGMRARTYADHSTLGRSE